MNLSYLHRGGFTVRKYLFLVLREDITQVPFLRIPSVMVSTDVPTNVAVLTGHLETKCILL